MAEETNLEVTELHNEETQVSKKPQYKLPCAKELPHVFRELVSNAPKKFKMATFIACCSPLGCLATRLRFHYTFDQQMQACLLQVIICGEQSSGKSFARNIENAIMAKQKVRDNEQRRIEQEYREKRQRQNKNKDADPSPKTTIVCVPVSISIAQLIKRADSPVRFHKAPLTLWQFTEELATATESNSRAFSNLKSIQRTAYDLGSEYGVDYLSDTSYSANVDILMNVMYCTTPSALDEYMNRKAIEGGNITRTILVELESNLGDDAPEFKPVTPEQQAELDHYIGLLMGETFNDDGSIKPEVYVDMKWLWKTVREWCAEKSNEAIRSGSSALGTFFKRSSVSAFRIATLCYHLYMLEADGKVTPKVHKRVRQIYLAMAEYILTNMFNKWGKRYEDLLAKRTENETTEKVNLFDSLPKQFSRNLLKEKIESLKLTTPNPVFICKWKKLLLIKETGKDMFEKI